MYRKKISSLLAASLFIGALASCGGDGTKTTDESTETTSLDSTTRE